MTHMENRDIVIGGRRFRNLDDLEDYCAYFPEFEEEVVESGLLTDEALRASVDTYWAASELEYGDGNSDIPAAIFYGWYVEGFIDKDG